MSVLLASAAELVSFVQQPVDSTSAALLLGIASDLVGQAVGTAVAGWTTDAVPAGVKGVVLAAAARAVVNPTGDSAQTVGSVATVFGRYNAGGVFLTADETRVCRQAGGVLTGTAMSVPMWEVC